MKSLQQEQLGRYRILEELGRGAMGIVHKAEDPSLARVVALKVVELPPDAFESQEYEARFYQEAKAAGSLNHPGIITIFDTGREGNWAYIAMELLDGTELRELMATSGHQADDALVRYRPAMHLAKHRDIVDARVGPCVAHQRQPAVQQHSDTIGHRVNLRSVPPAA